MELLRVYRAELFKIIKKPITRVLLILLAFPLFYGVSTAMNAPFIIMEGEFDVLLWASSIWFLLQLSTLPQVLIALLTAHSFANEIEGGQIRLALVKGCGRRNLLCSKVLAIITTIFIVYVLFYVVTIIIFFTFMKHTQYVGEELFVPDGLTRVLVTDLLFFSYMFLVSSIVFLLGIHYKTLISFLISIAISLAGMLLQYLPLIKYLVPLYVADRFNQEALSANSILIICFIYISVAIICLFFTEKKFSLMDIR